MLKEACISPVHGRILALAAFSAVFALIGAPAIASAQGTHLWTQSRIDEFEKGMPYGVAISSDGRLREAPGLKEVLTTPSTFVWSVAVDKKGTVFAGTGSPATVLRVGADGKSFPLFETRDVTVQVVRFAPDGSLYAATLPSGRVYKLNPNATEKQDASNATIVFDPAQIDAKPGDSTSAGKDAKSKSGDKDAKDDNDAKDGPPEKADSKPHYVWDLTFDSAGRMYVAAGGPAAIYRVDPAKSQTKPEEFFKSDEQHIRSMAWDAKGNLIAGTDGTGLVYRISPDGKGYVLFEAPRREIPTLAVGSNGTIYVASVGDKSRNPLPPLPVQGAGMVTITVVQPGSLQAANASASAPEGTEIYALTEGQAPRKLWAGKDEVVYALDARKDGLLVLTGNRGRLFRIQENGDFADVGHLQAQQGLCLATMPGSDEIFVGTGNTGKLVQLGEKDKHEYESDVLDAGSFARFGRIEVEPGSNAYDLLTRTGNVEQPVRGWSDWQPVKDGVVTSPAGRFLQWKAVLRSGGNVGAVGVNYLPVNAAPVVEDIVVVPGARLNPQGQGNQPQTINISMPTNNPNSIMNFDGAANAPLPATKDRNAVTARWGAHDDNGDDLTYSLYLRGDNEHVWRLLKENLGEKAYSFDGTLIPDGGYELKVVASDSPSHNPGEALSGEKVSDRFEIDTTPPVITNLKAAADSAQCAHSPCPVTAKVSLDAADAMSPVVKAEYSLDAGPWQYIEPVGSLSDSLQEHYDFTIPAAAFQGKNAGEHLITVRAYDRHDNVGLAKTVFTAPSGPAAK